ncbi:MAG: hypothetical protein KJ619_02250 [Candidatus Omnitrophica bacterium]|nr:hypothetical protein [Candidatus Omnitrophota bacterium]MBU2473915.1 hypothetical protein [Candidatus Omnitrophota bacterium]
MLNLFKGRSDKHSPRQFSLALLKLIELEGLVDAVNKFYDRLPKLIALKRPAFDELLKSILYRVTYAIMHPKVIERFQDFLPIEHDSAGYFFVTAELKEIRTKIEGSGVSQVKRDAVLQILESILINGLDSFHDLPAYRYFAAIAASKKSQTFSDDLRGIVETVSLLAKDTRTAAGYIGQTGEKTLAGEITAYEKNIIPKIRVASLLLYSLYFDLSNLFLGEFTDQSIEREIEAALGEDFPKDSLGGVFAALMDKRAYDKLKQKKIDYLNQMRKTFELRLYAPLALQLFRQNVSLDSKLNLPAYKIFSQLKVQEFLKYNQSGDYRAYVNLLKSAKNIRSSLISLLKDLSGRPDSSQMIAKYLKLFLAESSSERLLNSLKTKQFIGLWSQACCFGWDKELVSSLDITPAIVDDPNLLRLLMKEKSADLILMLNHTGFRDHLKRVKDSVIDFSLLYKVFGRSQELFNQVYPRLIVEDKRFVQILTGLLTRPEDASEILITDDLRLLVNSLGNNNSQDPKALIYLLKNFKAAQQALDYGYTPFSGRLEALEDKAAFIKWFFTNQESVIKKLSSAKAVSPHLGDSDEPRLREALSQLLEKQGEEFLKSLGGLRSWGYSQNLSQGAFTKVVEFFTVQNQAKRLVKRREIVNLVQYMAESAASRQWQEFLAEFTRIDGSTLTDYTVLFEKYQAAIILKSMQTHADIKTVKIIVETSEAAAAVQQKSFLQRLINVLADREIPDELISRLCFHIIKMHYAIADFGLGQLEQEKPSLEVSRIINSYKDDQEFRNSPPEVD